MAINTPNNGRPTLRNGYKNGYKLQTFAHVLNTQIEQEVALVLELALTHLHSPLSTFTHNIAN